jgi:hypothetical protein
MLFAAVHESAYGTKQTSHDVCAHVRFQGKSGQQMLKASFSAFDPELTSAGLRSCSTTG